METVPLAWSRGEPSNDPGNKDSCRKGTYCVVEAIHVRTGVPDPGLDRCDGHHEMVDLKLTKECALELHWLRINKNQRKHDATKHNHDKGYRCYCRRMI